MNTYSQAALWPAPSVPRHPAPFSRAILFVLADVLRRHKVRRVLDPMAGIGRLAEIRRLGFDGEVVLSEVEPEWTAVCLARGVPALVADAARLPFADGAFGAVATSPPYANRLADHHEARDGSLRRSYRHDLGRPLHPHNAGRMQWGAVYRQAMEAIWRECIRVVRPGGLLVVNVSDHVRGGRVVRVADWHQQALEEAGCVPVEKHRVPTPRLRYGSNREARVEAEAVLALRRP